MREQSKFKTAILQMIHHNWTRKDCLALRSKAGEWLCRIFAKIHQKVLMVISCSQDTFVHCSFLGYILINSWTKFPGCETLNLEESSGAAKIGDIHYLIAGGQVLILT